MFHVRVAALLAALTCISAATAQSPVRFRWQLGQSLTYRVEQSTTVQDTADKQTLTTQTKLNLTKRWHTAAVDAAGNATLQMSLLALRMETHKADGEVIVFDSLKPDAQQAELNKEMLQYIGQPIATLRLDARGRVIDVKESKFGPPSRFTSELPFKVALPDAGPEVDQTWERAYPIKLEPPQGVGEEFAAVQKYACRHAANGLLTIALSTHIKNLPEAAAERIPVIPMMPTGTLTFDARNGRLKKAELKMSADLLEHRGTGSKYAFSSNYLEELVEK